MDPRFACQHRGCSKSYLRKEHLNRHEKTHRCSALPMSPLRLVFQEKVCLRYVTSSWKAISYTSTSDILSRHIALSHGQCHNQEQQEPAGASEDATAILEQTQVENPTPLEDGRASSSTSTAIDDRDNLQDTLIEAYSRRFHSHWPILDRRTLRIPSQLPELTEAVQVAGLMMEGDPMREKEIKARHEAMLQFVNRNLFDDIQQNVEYLRPRPDHLPWFQALFIPIALCTYRGREYFAPLMMNTKHLYRLCNSAGLYSQRSIEASSASVTIQQQFQVLALLTFKLFLHVNGVIATHFPQFKYFEYFDPRVLDVSTPRNANEREFTTSQTQTKSSSTIANLFRTESTIPKAHLISRLVAWDLSLGLSLGCFMARDCNEDYPALMKRVGPYLFWHLKDDE
ncbi:hypothetical protein NM208_g5438 [Fusarium decemcellulare]|uniref:Uncharacterized protein n=1 Tax=Fusarium decemcellulare TaxID=57161 RepID=A0ACC1SGZ3_9HYPO|nr:hypothetical protein NM208_g5438 [Fusarium decemcellulare]